MVVISNKNSRSLNKKSKSTIYRVLQHIMTGFSITTKPNKDYIDITTPTKDSNTRYHNNLIKKLFSVILRFTTNSFKYISKTLSTPKLLERIQTHNSSNTSDIEETIRIKKPITEDRSYQQYLDYLNSIE